MAVERAVERRRSKGLGSVWIEGEEWTARTGGVGGLKMDYPQQGQPMESGEHSLKRESEELGARGNGYGGQLTKLLSEKEIKITHKEQLKEKMREENEMLKGNVLKQENMREALHEMELLCGKIEEKWKMKFADESQHRAKSPLNEATERLKKEYQDRLHVKEWQAQLDEFSQEINLFFNFINLKLKEQLYNQDEAYHILQNALDSKSKTSMELAKQVEEIMKCLAEKDQAIKELSDRLHFKETENELIKQDLQSESNDRARISEKLVKLQAQYEALKEESAKKEEYEVLDDRKQMHNTLMNDLEKSIREETANEKAKIAYLVQRNLQLEEHVEEKKRMEKRLIDLEHGETDRMKEMEEEIQVLTAQVNAYSREVDKQKGLVTQSQEKHKTEVSELNERLSNERKQPDNELARMRQQLANVSANNEELLRAYHEEQVIVTKLEDQIERMKQANKVLMEKIVALNQSHRLHEVERELSLKQKEVTSLRKMLLGFQKTWELSHKEVSLSSRELGRGAWGVVWVGQLKVAVKQIHQAIENQVYRDMFHHEINIMSQLRHPNLLQFVGAVLDHPSGYPMIITEVMDTSLRKAYENNELTPDSGCRPVILSIMHGVAEGLNYLHCLPDPVIHRDVSSANVLLQSIGYRSWKGKISDFGSAKLAKKAITKGPGAFVYGAPEAFQNRMTITKKQTTKMDTFSYGVLLCEIITCRFPMDREMKDMLCQVHSISDRPNGTRDTQGSLLHSLIVSCRHDDPSERPSMDQIIEQLDIIAK